MRPIETAETGYYPIRSLPVAERALASYWERRDVAPFRPQGVATKLVAVAEVNHGRWIVRCPFCTSAQLAAKSDRRFFCVTCLNEQVGRRWVRVMWPAASLVVGIEAALLVRPETAFMYWRPGESVADLAAENAAHGVR